MSEGVRTGLFLLYLWMIKTFLNGEEDWWMTLATSLRQKREGEGEKGYGVG